LTAPTPAPIWELDTTNAKYTESRNNQPASSLQEKSTFLKIPKVQFLNSMAVHKS
jgi:hypothetical protein